MIVSVGEYTGIIYREEAAIGIREGSTRDIAILSKVGKPVSFPITAIHFDCQPPVLELSRRCAQELALDFFCQETMIGSVLPATVTRIEYFGAFVDIGCGFISMVGIVNISISRISHPSCRFSVGQHIFVCITDFDRIRSRISLSHKELLGTWEENAAFFSPGMAVRGYVRGMKDYGVFIELTPISEPSPLRYHLPKGRVQGWQYAVRYHKWIREKKTDIKFLNSL